MSSSARKFVNSGESFEKLADYYSPKEMTEGQEIEGTYEGSFESGEPNEKGERGLTYKLRLPDGKLVGIGGCGSLNRDLAPHAIGTYVKLIYGGKKKMKTGPQKGKMAHNFTVQHDPDSVPAATAASDSAEE